MVYNVSILLFNSNHLSCFILGSHLSDAFGSLYTISHFLLHFIYLFLCVHVYVHMWVCVGVCAWAYVCKEAREVAIYLKTGVTATWGTAGLLCEYWNPNSSLLDCIVIVLNHELSLQPPVPKYLEPLLWFISSLISFMFKVFIIKV